jgi:hypothetical protein
MPVSVDCPMCGHENLFPDQYAGQMLACAHCGESLHVPEATAEPTPVDGGNPFAEPAPTPVKKPAPTPKVPKASAAKTWPARLRGQTCRSSGAICGALLGLYVGVEAGIWLAFRVGVLGYLLSLLTAPVGAIAGVVLGWKVGGILGRWIGDARFGVLGLLIGAAAGITLWMLGHEIPLPRLTTASLELSAWGRLAAVVALCGLSLGLGVAATERFLRLRRPGDDLQL